MGPSCSTHNPSPVDPDPRSVGRPGPTRASSGRDRRRVITSRPQPQATVRGQWGRTYHGGAELCRRNPGLAPARPGVHSTDISGPDVGAPSGNRWNPKVSLRRAAPVRLSCQHHGHQRPARTRQASSLRPILASKATSLPKVPARAGVSEVMTLTCLRSEETAQYPQRTRSYVKPRGRTLEPL